MHRQTKRPLAQTSQGTIRTTRRIDQKTGEHWMIVESKYWEVVVRLGVFLALSFGPVLPDLTTG